MDLKQMSIFREVMRTGSVSEAARNLNRTQPSVSHAIARLEEGLEMKLFERRRGRLHAVPEAQYLFRECEQVLTRVTSIQQNMKRMKSMEAGELRIVSMPGPSAVLLPRMICEHVGAHPDVRVTLLTRSSDAVAQLVGAQQFDVGVADHFPDRRPESALVVARTYQFRCVCALKADHPLADQDTIRPEDLSAMPMAMLFPEHHSHPATRRVFDAVGADLNIRFIGQFFQPLLAYVQAGHASMIVEPLAAESWRSSTANPEAIVFRRFEPAVIFAVDLLVPAYRPRSQLAQSFSNRLEDFLHQRSIQPNTMGES